MKEYKWSEDGMKQIITSGWKEFDRQTNFIGTGNVEANTQFSSYIRPWKKTECNGFVNPEGHLMDFDLKQFSNQRIPRDIENVLRNKEREESVILYMFFVLSKEKHVEPFCWVVTNDRHRLIAYRVTAGYRQNYSKRLEAGKEAMKYITE